MLVALDLSGRGYLSFDVPLRTSRVGSFDTELVLEFLRALAHNAGITLHVRLEHGHNSHHIIEAVFKGLGRALGETMAVTFVIGNANRMPTSLFSPGTSIASVLANEFGEAADLHLTTLFALGFLLFVITFVVLALAKLMIIRAERAKGT